MNKNWRSIHIACLASFSLKNTVVWKVKNRFIKKKYGFNTFFLLWPNKITPNDGSHVVIDSSWNLVILNGNHLCRKNIKVCWDKVLKRHGYHKWLYGAVRLTQIQNESMNSIVGSCCPKTLFIYASLHDFHM